jgi:hypothetical protein
MTGGNFCGVALQAVRKWMLDGDALEAKAFVVENDLKCRRDDATIGMAILVSRIAD